MIKWHEGVSEKLRVEAAATSTQRAVPKTTAREEHHMDDDASTTQSSIEEKSPADTADYFSKTHFRSPFTRPNIGIVRTPAAPHIHPQQQQQGLAPDGHHHDRRRSLPDNHHQRNPYWTNDAHTPTQSTAPHHIPPRSRPITSSTLSTNSDSEISDDDDDDDDDNSSTAGSEASHSPVVRYRDRAQLFPPSRQERRHSAHSPYDPRNSATPRPSEATPRPQQSYFDHRPPFGPSHGNAGGPNVRWRDVNHMWDLPGSAPATPAAHHGARPVEGRRDSFGGRAGAGRAGGPLRGVGGRRYPTDGIYWV